MRLDLVVGPNGAGKSTFVAEVLSAQVPRSSFVNADVIAAARWPDDPEGRSYEAAQVAAATRAQLLEARLPFIAETVFSHPSKVELAADAKAAGYRVFLHVVVVPLELSLQRVVFRVAAGGHSVPEHKVRDRYARIWPLVAEAARLADETYVWRNDGYDGPQLVSHLVLGTPDGASRWPSWTPEPLRALAP